MSNEILQLGNLLGAILQPIYFALFIIFTKKLKNKRILFVSIMIIEHILLKYVCKINYNINFELTYTIIYFLILKLLYKDKARITDVVTFVIAVIILGIFSVSTLLLLGVSIYSVVISNTLIILLTYLFRHKLSKIETFYSKFWNRHNDKRMLKSVTIRGLSSSITAIIFVLMHLWIIYGIYIVRR